MKKSIGIIGGMGSLATSDLFNKIVTLTDASNDREHIRIFIDNNSTIPDRTAAILHGGQSPVPAMSDSLAKLESIGADCIIMPCNTAHYFLPELKKRTTLPFVSMIDATALACARDFPGSTAAILATEGTVKSRIYQEVLSERGVAFLEPDAHELALLMDVIYGGVKAGQPPASYRGALTNVIDSMKHRGADYYILGCTELPIAFSSALSSPLSSTPSSQLPSPLPASPTNPQPSSLLPSAIDPTCELAKAAIRFCGYDVKLP